MARVQHKYDTSATQTKRLRHERQILILITTEVQTCVKTFTPYISYMENARLEGEE